MQGEAWVPASKSHTLRAILFASLAHGRSVITNYLHSPDTESMIRSCRLFGSRIEKTQSTLTIYGTSPRFPTSGVIQAQDSGIVFRFLTALSALSSHPVCITGSQTLLNRPILPLLSALGSLGCVYHRTIDESVVIRGPLQTGHTEVIGSDSQYASALAIACSLGEGPFSFSIKQLKEKPWFDLTLWWLRKTSIPFSYEKDRFVFPGQATPFPFSYHVGGDFSSAAFLLAAGLLSHAPIRLMGLSMSDPQGDKEVFKLMKTLGAQISFKENSVTISPSVFMGGDIDMDPFIDALPILAVLACFAKTPTKLYNAEGARNKESNRIAAITQELQKMGAHIVATHDGLLITPSKLHGARLFSHNDHRIAMALTIAAMYASGSSEILSTGCVQKTFPHFPTVLRSLGVHIEESTYSIPMWTAHCR